MLAERIADTGERYPGTQAANILGLSVATSKEWLREGARRACETKSAGGMPDEAVHERLPDRPLRAEEDLRSLGAGGRRARAPKEGLASL